MKEKVDGVRNLNIRQAIDGENNYKAVLNKNIFYVKYASDS